MNAKIKMIVKEFYTAMTCAMDYEWNEQHKSLAHKVLNFLLEINGEAELLDEIWSVIHGAACVKTCADVSLMGSLENTVSEDVKMAIGIKSDILFSKQITRQKPFDIDLLKESLRTPVEGRDSRLQTVGGFVLAGTGGSVRKADCDLDLGDAGDQRRRDGDAGVGVGPQDAWQGARC